VSGGGLPGSAGWRVTVQFQAHNECARMHSLYVVGGQQRAPRPLLSSTAARYHYQKGLILEVWPSEQTADVRVEYVSPLDVRGADDPVLFKSATLTGDILYACTQTEVLLYRVPAFEQIGYVSLPCFNDVHHVRPSPEGDLLIANSGLDMVLEVTLAGEVVREWNVLGEDPWERFSRTIDYRKGISTKPHQSHPNYLFCVGSDVWVTRFEQKDAICLTNPGRTISIGLERVHDGLVHDGLIYFTTVDGRVVIVNASTLQIAEVVSLTSMHEADGVLGWCRGILIDGSKIWVGFSRLRPTRFRENVSWVTHGFKGVQPTHLGCYDLIKRECLAEIDMEPHRLNAIFSIHPGGVIRA
jgi:hypothetical protein